MRAHSSQRIRRLINQSIKCSDLHQSTLQAGFLKKQLYLDQDLVRLNIWDTVEYFEIANPPRVALFIASRASETNPICRPEPTKITPTHHELEL